MIRIWDATPLEENEGIEALTLEHEHEVWCVTFSPNGQLLASVEWTGTIQLRDANTGALSRSLHGPNEAVNFFHAAFSPDSRQIAGAAHSADRIALVTAWDTAPVKSVTYSPDGQRIATGSEDATRRAERLAESERQERIAGQRQLYVANMNLAQAAWEQNNVFSVAFSPDSQRIVTGGQDEKARVWDVNDCRSASMLRRRG